MKQTNRCKVKYTETTLCLLWKIDDFFSRMKNRTFSIKVNLKKKISTWNYKNLQLRIVRAKPTYEVYNKRIIKKNRQGLCLDLGLVCRAYSPRSNTWHELWTRFITLFSLRNKNNESIYSLVLNMYTVKENDVKW